MDEFGIIERFFRRQRVRRADVTLGIGDDAAIVRPPAGRELVVTTDVLVNGVHFPEDTDAGDVGYKSLAVNLSDIAAMGASPAWATLGLTLPEADADWLEGFAAGLFEAAEAFDVQLVGGDVTSGPLCIAVQLIGIVDDAGPLTRAGARDGDLVYVSGTLGDAALGLRVVQGMLDVPAADAELFRRRLHRPTPRVALGRALAGLASAAIDISDGLAADLGHLCECSGAGSVVDVADLPLSESYQRILDEVGPGPALSFGDDYELCFTAPPDRARDVDRVGKELGLTLTRVGQITGSAVVWLNNGESFPIGEHGFQHFH